MKSKSSLLLLGLLVVGLSLTGFFLFSGDGPTTGTAGLPEPPPDRDVTHTPTPATELDALAPRIEEPTRTARTALVQEPEEEPEAHPKEPAGPPMTGRLLDPFGNPVADAFVDVSKWQAAATGMMMAGMGGGTGGPDGDSRYAVRTDARGRFSIPRRPKLTGELAVAATARGFLVLRERRVVDTEKGAVDLGDFHLEPGVVLGGIVVDHQNVPVAGARVRRSDGQNGGIFEISGAFLEEMGMGGLVGKEVTDEEGRFEFPNEAPGAFTLTVEHEDYPETRIERESPPAGGEMTDLVIHMREGASIEGRITGLPESKENVHLMARLLEVQDEDGADFMDMLGDAGMFANNPSTEVAEDGSFAVRGLEPGARYELRAFTKGAMFQRRPVTKELEATAGDEGVELPYDAGTTLTFKVVDDATEDPITTLEVWHAWTDGGDMMAAMSAAFGGSKAKDYPKGIVELTELRPSSDPGHMDLRVGAPGYLEVERDGIEVAQNTTVDLGVVRLRRAPTLRVRVTEAKSGKPVARARVRLSSGTSLMDMARQRRNGNINVEIDLGSDGEFDVADMRSQAASGKTDSKGVCEMPAFGTELGVLEVRSPKFSTLVKEPVVVNSTGTTELEVMLVRGGEVEVRVVDSRNRPLPGVSVRHRDPDDVEQTSRQTNKHGVATFRRLQPGPHSFLAEHRRGGLQGMFGGVDLDMPDNGQDEEWTPIGVVDGTTSSLKLSAPGFGNLAGVVTSNGLPLRGASVSLAAADSDDDNELAQLGGRFGELLESGGLRDVTDEDGRYEISSVPAGEYRIVVRHENRAMPSSLKTHVEEGDNTFDARLTLTVIEGRVLDDTGDPIANAEVEVQRSDSSDEFMAASEVMAGPLAEFFGNDRDKTLTAADGSYRLEGVEPGVELRVVARKKGFSPQRSDPVTVAEGEVAIRVDVELQSAGSLRVLVQGPTRPFMAVSATYAGELGEDETAATKIGIVQQGEAVLEGLRPGPWDVSLQRGPEGESSRQVLIVKDEETAVTLTTE